MADEKTFAELAPTLAAAGVEEAAVVDKATESIEAATPPKVEPEPELTKAQGIELLSYFAWHGQSYVPAPYDHVYGGKSLEQAAAAVGVPLAKVKALYEEFCAVRNQEAAKIAASKAADPGIIEGDPKVIGG